MAMYGYLCAQLIRTEKGASNNYVIIIIIIIYYYTVAIMSVKVFTIPSIIITVTKCRSMGLIVWLL